VAGIALITGINGFVGSHLAEYLLKEGLEVYGTVQHKSSRDNIEHIEKKLRLFEADIRDARRLPPFLRVGKHR